MHVDLKKHFDIGAFFKNVLCIELINVELYLLTWLLLFFYLFNRDGAFLISHLYKRSTGHDQGSRVELRRLRRGHDAHNFRRETDDVGLRRQVGVHLLCRH